MNPLDPMYESAVNHAGFFPVTQGGYLRLSGEDQLAYLQRQTSNDIQLLAEGRALLSVLTSPAARILDVFYLLQDKEGIGLITLPGYAENTYKFLKSRIFFMDKVEISDESAQFIQIDMFGPRIRDALGKLNIPQIPEVDGSIKFISAESEARLIQMQPVIGLGYRLLMKKETWPDFMPQLIAVGIIEINERIYQILHVEAGIPSAGTELNDAYTPLETGLEVAVSGSKGCYTGQEVIARQVTYDKVTQKLCRIQMEHPPKNNSRLWDGDKPVGEITSWVDSPRFGFIALAMVRRPHDQPEKILEALDEDGKKMAVKVVRSHQVQVVPGS